VVPRESGLDVDRIDDRFELGLVLGRRHRWNSSEERQPLAFDVQRVDAKHLVVALHVLVHPREKATGARCDVRDDRQLDDLARIPIDRDVGERACIEPILPGQGLEQLVDARTRRG
jgi:hypothetical protein